MVLNRLKLARESFVRSRTLKILVSTQQMNNPCSKVDKQEQHRD